MKLTDAAYTAFEVAEQNLYEFIRTVGFTDTLEEQRASYDMALLKADAYETGNAILRAVGLLSS